MRVAPLFPVQVGNPNHYSLALPLAVGDLAIPIVECALWKRSEARDLGRR
jgi:hypothetical protein